MTKHHRFLWVLPVLLFTTISAAAEVDSSKTTVRSQPVSTYPSDAKKFTGIGSDDWFTGFGPDVELPTENDVVVITSSCTVRQSWPYAECKDLIVADGAKLTIESRGSIRINGSIRCEGTGTIILNNGGSLAAPRSNFVLWLIIGFTAQALFTSRFLVQWIASERAKASVIPRMFWVLSLAGSAMLLSYAIYRKDIVIMCGQSFGSFVYIRNLILGKQKK